MKKQLLCTSILAVLFSFNTVYGQDFIKNKINNENGGLSLVVFKENAQLTSASTKNLFQDILKLEATEELRLLKV